MDYFVLMTNTEVLKYIYFLGGIYIFLHHKLYYSIPFFRVFYSIFLHLFLHSDLF